MDYVLINTCLLNVPVTRGTVVISVRLTTTTVVDTCAMQGTVWMVTKLILATVQTQGLLVNFVIQSVDQTHVFMGLVLTNVTVILVGRVQIVILK